MILPAVMLPVAVIKPAVVILPAVALPVAVIKPAVVILPAVMLPVAVIKPAVVISPVALITPDTRTLVFETTTTLLVLLTDMDILPAV